MGFEEIRQKNAARQQMLQSRTNGAFVKWSNDKDAKLVKITSPFEGFDREIKQKDGTSRTRPHYRMHVLGEANFKTGEGAGVSNMTPDHVLGLASVDAKIVTAPQSMANRISEAIMEGHIILGIVRNGVANSKDTTYSVMTIERLTDKELKVLTPKLSKTDLEHIEAIEKWEDISPEERDAIENFGLEG